MIQLLTTTLLIAALFLICYFAWRDSRRRIREVGNAVRIWDLIEILRDMEGDSVEILSDNADFGNGSNCAIHCNGDWTQFTTRRFEGDTILDCLEDAMRAKCRNYGRPTQ